MRGSILRLDKHYARLLGITLAGVLAFAAGMLALRYRSGAPTTDRVAWQIGLDGLNSRQKTTGPVYLMDEAAGTVSLIGAFQCGQNSGWLKVEVPRGLLMPSQRFTGVFWESNPKTYVPHVQFVFNDDMNSRLNLAYRAAESDPEVRQALSAFGEAWAKALSSRIGPAVQDLLDSPTLRQSLLDAALATALEMLAQRRGYELDDLPRENGAARDELYRLLREHVSGNTSKWLKELMNDPTLRATTDTLRKVIEPHALNGLQQILWTAGLDGRVKPGKSGTPNARILWIGRRIMFGADTPAILLFPSDEGQPLNGNSFYCRPAP